MEIKVTNAEVDSTTVWIALDIMIHHDGKDHELELCVRYDNSISMGATEISWEIAGGDDDILDEDDFQDQLDDFVQEYVYENIGKM
jgi:hypothetical protein